MKRYYMLILLGLMFLLSGCDALEARRLEAEAAASRAKAEQARAEAAEISAAYAGKVDVIEAKQEAAEEDRESRWLAETQRVLLRQLELEHKAARRASDMAALGILAFWIGLPASIAVVFFIWYKHNHRGRGDTLLWREQERLRASWHAMAIRARQIERAERAYYVIAAEEEAER